MLLLLSLVLANAADWPTPDTDPAPWSSLPSGVEVQDPVVGTGTEVVPFAVAEVNYTGMLADGTVFDTSRERGQTLSFKVGAQQVIHGWEDGLVGMRIGGRRRLVIPASQGYGDRDMGAIPPGSTLYFEVELVGVVPPRAAPERTEIEASAWRDLEPVQVADLRVGDGGRVRPKHRICTDYVGWKDTEVIEQTFGRDRCTWIRLSDDNLPAELELGLAGMHEGGARRIRLSDGREYQVEITTSQK